METVQQRIKKRKGKVRGGRRDGRGNRCKTREKIRQTEIY